MKKSFLGTGWSFPPRFDDPTSGVNLSSDGKNIEESIVAIVQTIPGERVMHVQFGCNLRDVLFAPMNLTNQTMAKEKIKTALIDYEPRIEVDDVILHLDNYNEGKLEIEVIYTIIKTNERRNIVYPYYLIEGTDI